MKPSFLIICCVGICLAVTHVQLRAQAPAAEPTPAPAYSADDLDQLLGPIALYPDPLIALILPASTTPSDVVLASRYLEAKGDPEKATDKPWDDSVKALLHYPDVVNYMNKNLDWTTSLGEAFIAQPADVMNSIQQLRAKAKTAGNLKDTPQQTVTEKDQQIIVMPAEKETIYVPVYDPTVVYVTNPTPPLAPLITFGVGLAVGAWLNHDCDWYGHGVYVGAWNTNMGWGNRPVYNNNINRNTNINIDNSKNFNGGGNNIHNGNNNGGKWKPNPSRPTPGRPANRPGGNGGGVPNRPGGGGLNPGGGGGLPNRPGGGGGGVPNHPGGGGGLPSRPGAGGGGVPKRPSTLPAKPPGGGSAFSGYGRGSSANSFSQRGQSSRQFSRPSTPAARPSGGGGRSLGGGRRGR